MGTYKQTEELREGFELSTGITVVDRKNVLIHRDIIIKTQRRNNPMEGNTMLQQDDEMEIDLWEICLLFLRNLPLILSAGIFVALCLFLGTRLLIAPTYESTTKIYILNKQESNNLTYSDIQLGTQLTADYAELIQSRFVLEEVIQVLNLDSDYEELSKRVSVTTPEDTRILSIAVTDTDPVRAMDTANAIREVASIHITNVMDIEAVNVVETANMPMTKAGPSVLRNTMIGAILGAFIVIAVLIIRFLMDDTIKTSEDVEKYLQLSVLAVIPLSEGDVDSQKKRKLKKA